MPPLFRSGARKSALVPCRLSHSSRCSGMPFGLQCPRTRRTTFTGQEPLRSALFSLPRCLYKQIRSHRGSPFPPPGSIWGSRIVIPTHVLGRAVPLLAIQMPFAGVNVPRGLLPLCSSAFKADAASEVCAWRVRSLVLDGLRRVLSIQVRINSPFRLFRWGLVQPRFPNSWKEIVVLKTPCDAGGHEQWKC
jgi:hypothetical protein